MSVQELTKQAAELLPQVQGASKAEHEALAERINELRANVMVLGEEHGALKHQVARLVVLNQIVVEGPQLPLPHDKVVSVLGKMNQYVAGGGPNSSCTSCAQCFLARILPKGTACSIQPDEIDGIVQDGYHNFDLLLKIKIKEAAKAGMPEDVIVAQAMDTSECSDIYGLKVLNAGGDQAKRVLVKGEDHTTKGFFRELLTAFRAGIGKRNALGGVIHSQGKTYALALFQSAHGFEWALFDSHGHPDGQDAAYVKHTDSLEEMVKALSQLIEYKACDPSFGFSEAEKAMIEPENNEFILYVVEHQDHVLLAEPCEIPDEIPVNDPKIDSNVPIHPETSNIERHVALFLLIIAALGISYRFYLNRQIPQDVVVIPTKA